ncbi:TRAPP subunit TRS20 [Ascoidea rubescens DSM 1968]|uniref:Sedlin n=1 Tax=Ascoidea rubescens DSM 1968 TaxID=1344418 RepID=A0A1D2VSF1_9ASCO|nr:Sedlin [Ascoidea rubescens DSM 1968]ODV64508.1 Sedlin [Ascoidea rubescens DSM 1968]
MSYYFAMIGTRDNPIYEAELGTFKQGGDGTPKFSAEMKELNPFIIHSSLDIVEDLQWATNSLYLKIIDNYYGYYVSAYVTPTNIKFMLLHENKNEENIKQFFIEVNDLYLKTLLNPFYSVNDPIKSTMFDSKIKLLTKKYL